MRHGLPEPNTIVRVCVGEDTGEGYASRVEANHGSVLTVAAPAFVGDLFAMREGMTVLVRWIGGQGVFEVEGLLQSINRDASVLVWMIRATGDVQLSQRRRYTRMPFPQRVIVHLPLGSPGVRSVPDGVCFDGESARAVGVDLGEGGIRLRVRGAYPVGQPVVIELPLDDEILVLTGRVLRARPVGTNSEGTGTTTSDRGQPQDTEIVVEFDDPTPGEGSIRRWVLWQQVLAHHRERASG